MTKLFHSLYSLLSLLIILHYYIFVFHLISSIWFISNTLLRGKKKNNVNKKVINVIKKIKNKAFFVVVVVVYSRDTTQLIPEYHLWHAKCAVENINFFFFCLYFKGKIRNRNKANKMFSTNASQHQYFHCSF